MSGLFGGSSSESDSETLGGAFRAGNTSESDQGGNASPEYVQEEQTFGGTPIPRQEAVSVSQFDRSLDSSSDENEPMQAGEPVDEQHSSKALSSSEEEEEGGYNRPAKRMNSSSEEEGGEGTPKRDTVVSTDEEENEQASRPANRSIESSDEEDHQVAVPQLKEVVMSSDDEGENIDAVIRSSRRGAASDEGSDDDAVKRAETDLFGDADDISSDDEQEKGNKTPVRNFVSSDDENEGHINLRNQYDDSDDNEPKETAAPVPDSTVIEVDIPKITTDLGKQVHFVRFPNFLSVEARPFDPAMYEDEVEDDELLDEEGRARLKLKVENTIRWRKYTDENGIELTDSNARVVKWSDGSMSMHLGSEIFDIQQMPLKGDQDHLFIRQGTGLQGQAVFRTKLSFRPHSTKSATHRKMTNRLALRHSQNQQKIRVMAVAGEDPESKKEERIKKEEEELRAHMRREAQARRVKEKAHAKGLSNNYLDDPYDNDDNDHGVSVSAIKNRFKSGFLGRRGSSSDDSDAADTSKHTRNLQSSDSEDNDDDDDFGLDGKRRKLDDSATKKKRRVVSDDDDSDAASGDEKRVDYSPAASGDEKRVEYSPASSPARQASDSSPLAASPSAASSAAGSPAAAASPASASSSSAASSPRRQRSSPPPQQRRRQQQNSPSPQPQASPAQVSSSDISDSDESE